MHNVSSKLWRLVSDGDKQIYNIINIIIITNALSLMGVVTNAINIIVFYKQGLASTTNMSFFALAISDLCSLLLLLVLSFWVNPWTVNSDLPIAPWEMLYLTSGQPHICFARITGCITVYITAERCLCIIIPLKIKQIVTAKVTATTLGMIYLVNIATFLPEFATAYIGWKFYPEKNRTLLGVLFTENRGNTEGLVYILYSVLGLITFLLIIVFTAILVIQLREKSQWRMKANAQRSASESILTRERKSAKMIVMITTILIVCYIPGAGGSMVTFFVSEFSITGQFANAFIVLWSFALVFDAINSSVNIFLYYKMSSKYRKTFNQMFGISEVS